MKRINISFDDELYQKTKEKSQKMGITFSELVRKGIIKMLGDQQ